MMGPLNVMGLLGFGLSRRSIHPKVCSRCKRFIKVGEGYTEKDGVLLHGRCTDEAKGKKEAPAESKEPPMG